MTQHQSTVLWMLVFPYSNLLLTVCILTEAIMSLWYLYMYRQTPI